MASTVRSVVLALVVATAFGCQGPDDPLPGDPCPGLGEKALPGYTLFDAATPDGTTLRTLLVDMDGKLVHGWDLAGFPGKMLPGGQVMGAHRMRAGFNLIQDALAVARVDWDGKVLWSFSAFDDDGTGTKMARQHHDWQLEGNPVGYYAPGAAPLTSGKVLVLGHLTVTRSAVSDKTLLDDVIYEVTGAGKLSGFVWRPLDHIDEMGFDAAARRHIRDNPNFDKARGNGNWLHINSVSWLGPNRWHDAGDARFAPDNLIVSAREASFIAIIGRKSGAIVWRVGPDFGEGQTGRALGPIIGPHHAHMIPKGLPGAGNILVFDNGGAAGYGGAGGGYKHTRMYSRALEFDPVSYRAVWQYGSSTGDDQLFSAWVGSAQRLPNGNTLVNEGLSKTVLEVTPGKKVVWRFVSPYATVNNLDLIYRAYRVPPEWLPDGKNIRGYRRWSDVCPVR